ncbi:MAG: dehydrogenase, partial [Verrucomicrobiae bacterium]|nr:dehydrogenase [Verrucomicrobiae bacterium]
MSLPRLAHRLRLVAIASAIVPCWIADPTLFAQRGDREGHDMAPPPADWKIPPAPVVTADAAAKTFALPEGFHIELVAAEPLIHDPVALAFDGNGRIWVVEMRGYMPDIDGHGEDLPTGRISVLVDEDGDGKADRHTVFLDKLVMPRAVALTDNDRSMLYADGASLYQVAIVEGKDGLPTAGKQTMVDEDYAKGGNPEHKPNGLRYALDNWIYSSKCDRRYRRVDGKWIEEKTEFRGQWGIDQDDQGRLFTNTNSNCVSAEEIPAGLTVANPNHEFRSPVTTKLSKQTMWPSRLTPGINRGYMKDFLTDEGYLKAPTAVSGLAIYRGDQFPAEFH